MSNVIDPRLLRLLGPKALTLTLSQRERGFERPFSVEKQPYPNTDGAFLNLNLVVDQVQVQVQDQLRQRAPRFPGT